MKLSSFALFYFNFWQNKTFFVKLTNFLTCSVILFVIYFEKGEKYGKKNRRDKW